MDLRKRLDYNVPSGLYCGKCITCPEPCFSFMPPPSPPPPPPPAHVQSPHHKHFTLPIFVTVAIVILATAFFFFICFTVYRFYTCWRRSGRRQPAPPDDGEEEFLGEDRGPVVDHPIWYIRTVGLDAAVIEAITIVRYKRGEGLIDGTDCSVCLNEFQDDETLRLLPKCSHAFHLPCIDTWLRSHTNCPMCRARIIADNTPASAPMPAVQNSEEIQITVSEVEPEAQPSGGELDGSGGLQQQPVRRSVSLDSMSALAIHNAVRRQLKRDSDKQMIEEKGEIETAKDSNGGINELSGSPSSIQTGTSAVKRSLSCSAKVFLARHSSRSRNSQL